MGLSDWHGYALRLARKFNYTNTYYHAEPRMDITNVPAALTASLDFLISSDVFEHIVSPVSVAFDNSFKMLKPGGVLVLTVPFVPHGETVEHFDQLYEYKVIDDEGRKKLKNVNREGIVRWYDDLIFHGGCGATLEMRVFALQSLIKNFRDAGFEEITRFNHAIPLFGITADEYSYPIVGRRPI